jgi:hypothetical protein
MWVSMLLNQNIVKLLLSRVVALVVVLAVESPLVLVVVVVVVVAIPERGVLRVSSVSQSCEEVLYENLNQCLLIAVLCIRREGNRSGVWSAPCSTARFGASCNGYSFCGLHSLKLTADRQTD